MIIDLVLNVIFFFNFINLDRILIYGLDLILYFLVLVNLIYKDVNILVYDVINLIWVILEINILDNCFKCIVFLLVG